MWSSWQQYEKVTIDGHIYAKVDDRLYSKHAVDRTQPSMNRFGLNILPFPDGDYGRSISPAYVEYVISEAEPIFQEDYGNYKYILGDLEIILSPEGRVVTLNAFAQKRRK